MLCCVYARATMCMPSAHGGQKRALDPVELESRMLVSCYGFWGTHLRLSARTASAPNLRDISPAPENYYFSYRTA